GTDFRALGEGKRTVVYEYVPAHLEKQVHVQETLACRCGECVMMAPAPKAVEGGQYGPGLMAHVAVSKCLDSTPLYRRLLDVFRLEEYDQADETPQRV
ncbi:MAG: hypothetical protein RL653_679, partial [Pseudomonadota bacterium]